MVSIKDKNKDFTKIYKEKCSLCESQNYYMNRFIKNKYRSFKILNDAGVTLHYTSLFDNIKKDIYELSKKNSFYLNDIYCLFIRDNKHTKLILQDYHCLYLKKDYDIIGYILFTTDINEVILQFLLIDPLYQKKSLGTFLINMLEICIHYLRDTGLLKYKNGIISAYTYSPTMMHILEKLNYVKQKSHTNNNIQDHDLFSKKFL
jgi:GNAT superfamily N-acetyltransferase